ncbi:MAG: hypothetical protein NVSMB2_12410 [Chloroflexota bacterium]
MRNRRTRAQALIWIMLMLPVFLSTVGLALDGGILLVRHRQLQSVADGAARAGATRLDLDRLRSSGGVDVQLDQALAQDVALTYIAGVLQVERTSQDGLTANVGVTSRRVDVTLQTTTRTAFLRIAHIDSVPLTVGAEAEVQFGIHDGQGG